MKPVIKWREDQKYCVTNHCIERFITRFRQSKKYKPLTQSSSSQHNSRANTLTYELRREIRENGDYWRAEIEDILSKAEERKNMINDSSFMDHVYNRYGTEHRFRFLVSGEVVFIVKEVAKSIVQTCIPLKTSKASARKSFRKKKV